MDEKLIEGGAEDASVLACFRSFVRLCRGKEWLVCIEEAWREGREWGEYDSFPSVTTFASLSFVHVQERVSRARLSSSKLRLSSISAFTPSCCSLLLCYLIHLISRLSPCLSRSRTRSVTVTPSPSIDRALHPPLFFLTMVGSPSWVLTRVLSRTGYSPKIAL